MQPYDSPRPQGFWGFIGRIWSWVDASRRFILNVLFLLILVFLVSMAFSPAAPGLQSKTVLVLNLTGKLVEQRTSGGRAQALTRAFEDEDPETQLRDVTAVLEAAAKDSKIDRVLLMTDDFDGAGLAGLREVASALEKFKASGKQVVAWGSQFDQKRFYLAAHANEIYVHPMGAVLLEGFGGQRNYYRGALDRLGVTANVIRAGKYKNFGENFVATGPSKETMESDKFLYDGLWNTYTSDVEKARKLPAGSLAKAIEELVPRLKAVQGDAAKLALAEKWVTGLKTRDELRLLLIERGEKNEEAQTFRQVAFHDYLATIKPTLMGDAVGVIVAEGEIVDGNQPAGRVGGRSTSELIRRARNDNSIKSIVLRVNSPGGSAFGSELIRRELEITRAAGKPIVISMGDVAASGGYWVSMSSDEVIADAATITGSIGVYGMLPTGEKAMEKLSINTGGYATTWLRESGYDPRRALDPRFAELVQVSIDRIYSDFTTRAAAARKTTPDKIDEVAQGRVWTGAQAKERGLVDRLGSFNDAVKSAATRAKLGDDARVVYIEPERTKLEKLLDHMGLGAVAQLANNAVARWEAKAITEMLPSPAAREAFKEFAWLAEMSERAKAGLPFTVVAHCFCGR